jgi:hypothetical protein
MARVEFESSEDPAVIAEGIALQGCAVVRRLFDRQVIAATRDRVARRLGQLDGLRLGGYWNNPLVSFCDESDISVEINGQVVDMPVMLAGWKDLSDREPHRFSFSTVKMLAKSPAAAIAQAYFGEPVVCAVGSSRLRRQRIEERANSLPLHQDGASGDYGEGVGLTVFFPLNGCGGVYPGLEVVPQRFFEAFPTGEGSTYCADHVLEELAQDLWAPDMQVGDALIFDSYAPHRTCFGAQAALERISCDMRMFARSLAPSGLSSMVDLG